VAVLIPLAVEKKIVCNERGCAEILTIQSPDDLHTFFIFSKLGSDSIPKEYTCNKGHVTVGYWTLEDAAALF